MSVLTKKEKERKLAELENLRKGGATEAANKLAQATQLENELILDEYNELSAAVADGEALNQDLAMAMRGAGKVEVFVNVFADQTDPKAVKAVKITITPETATQNPELYAHFTRNGASGLGECLRSAVAFNATGPLGKFSNENFNKIAELRGAGLIA